LNSSIPAPRRSSLPLARAGTNTKVG
jgi:hypothetical protein